MPPAGQRYEEAAVSAIGPDEGAALVADPAGGAVTRRLYDAEGDGWDPERLLSLAAGQRELGSADSVAEVLSWRIDGYLAEHPAPPVTGRLAPESGAAVWERLTAVVASLLGPQLPAHTQEEKAWPALIAALRRAQDADFDASELRRHDNRGGAGAAARGGRRAGGGGLRPAWHYAKGPASTESRIIAASSICPA